MKIAKLITWQWGSLESREWPFADTVLLTGKSHEKSMNYDGTKEEPWDETQWALHALQIRTEKS